MREKEIENRNKERDTHREGVTETNPFYTHHTNKAYNSENIELFKERERKGLIEIERDRKNLNKERETHRERVTETNPLYTHHTNKAYNRENIVVIKEIERD